MKLKKITAAVCLGLLMAALLLSGCGSEKTETQTTEIGELSQGSCLSLIHISI